VASQLFGSVYRQINIWYLLVEFRLELILNGLLNRFETKNPPLLIWQDLLYSIMEELNYLVIIHLI
jgi:hypothetical protein